MPTGFGQESLGRSTNPVWGLTKLGQGETQMMVQECREMMIPTVGWPRCDPVPPPQNHSIMNGRQVVNGFDGLPEQILQFMLGLDLPKILVEVERRGSSFAELLTIPEQVDWIYVDGKSTSCVAFILEMYKEAGLFDKIRHNFFKNNLSRLPIWCNDGDSVKLWFLNFFKNNLSRLPIWCNDGDSVKLLFCQIIGKYRMKLPGYNTIEPYSHIAENFPSMPLDYFRLEYC
ncbi:hypothetical protein Tco_0850663 [Tanacetum coccineum]